MSREIHPSVLGGYGLIEAPFDLATPAFGTHRRAAAAQMSIVKGSATVTIGGRPAARMGDQTAHGGVIAAGAPDVMIGG